MVAPNTNTNTRPQPAPRVAQAPGSRPGSPGNPLTPSDIPGGPPPGSGGPYNGPPASVGQAPTTQAYQSPVAVTGGASRQALGAASQSFSNPQNTTGAVPFWQSPNIQVAAQHGYDPGQTYASQQVTGSSIQSDPYVAAALANFNQNVAPGITDQMNAMGLGRSTAALNAMARAQASLMPSLYAQSGANEQQRIQNQINAGQFSAGLSQADLGRLEGATQFDTGIRQQAANQAQQGQQNLFQNLMQLQNQNFNQQMGSSGQLFSQGTVAQQTGQQGNQNAYQDYLRRMGLSEEAINPFGGISGLLGTVTSGK